MRSVLPLVLGEVVGEQAGAVAGQELLRAESVARAGSAMAALVAEAVEQQARAVSEEAVGEGWEERSRGRREVAALLQDAATTVHRRVHRQVGREGGREAAGLDRPSNQPIDRSLTGWMDAWSMGRWARP